MLRSLAGLAVVCCLAAAAVADEHVDVATMLKGLHSPCGVAIRPEASDGAYEIYVSEAGAGRIVRIRSGQPRTSEDAITGFASQSGGDPFQLAGPQGLVFLDRTRLVVSGNESEGRPYIRLYELADEQTPLLAARYEQHIEPIAGEERPAAAVTSFHGLARTLANDRVADMLVVAALGKQGSTGIWKMSIRGGLLGELESLASMKPSDEPTIPSAIAVGPHGYILVSQPTAETGPYVTRLKFVNPIDGSVTLQVAAKLPAIVDLAYSPQTGNLYAAVLAIGAAEHDGVYRIDDIGDPGKPDCAAVKVADPQRPTALAFGPDGALYVTAVGEAGDNNTNTGVLLKLSGEL